MISLALLLMNLQDSKVSLEIRGERLIVCAPKIAQALGMPQLTIRAPFQEEVAAIRVTNVDRQTLKQKIEQAFRGTFIQKENEWTFEQTIDQKAQEQQGYLQWLNKDRKEFIDSAKTRLATLKSFNKDEARRVANMYATDREQEDGVSTPLERFQIEIASRLTPGTWGRVGLGAKRRLFSLRPTQMQESMPFDVNDIVGRYVSNSQMLREELQGRNGLEPEEIPAPITLSDFSHLTIELDMDSVEICAYNAQGEETTSSWEPLPRSKRQNSEVEVAKKYAQFEPKLSSIASEYMAFMDPPKSASDPTYPQGSPALREMLLHPERVDPLSIALPEVLFGSNPGLEIVAAVDDSYYSKRNLNVGLINEALLASEELKVAGNWLIIPKRFSYEGRGRTINRRRMGEITRMTILGSYPTLDVVAEYADELLSTIEPQVCLQGLVILLDNDYNTVPLVGQEMYIYRALTAAERSAALTRAVKVSELNANAIKALADQIFTYSNEGFIQPVESLGDAKTRRDQALLERGLMKESTFRHPHGVLPNMTLQFATQDFNLVKIGLVTPIENRAHAETSARSLGADKFRSEYPSKYPTTPGKLANYNLDAITLRKFRWIDMNFETLDGWMYQFMVFENFRKDPKVYSIKTLPEAYLKDIQSGYEAAKKRFETSSGDGG